MILNNDHRPVKHKRELEFIDNYPTGRRLLYEPKTFYLSASKYTPDFYDPIRKVYIEVSGTRQAYHHNKNKYAEFVKTYPRILFEIRLPSGDKCKWILPEYKYVQKSEPIIKELTESEKRSPFRTKLNIYIRRNNIPVYRLEDMVGVSRGVIYRYLKGERGMTLTSVEKILSVVDKSDI